MKTEIKGLILLFLIIAVAKAILSYFVPSISAFSDEYYYVKMARSIFFDQEISVHNIKIMFYQPLYAIVLSLAYVFKDMEIVYFVMKVINAILSTLIIIPTYLLAKEFLDNKKSVLLTGLVAIMPSNFSFNPYIMPENLFYTLFVAYFYFLYKAFTSQSTKYFALAGLFMGLAFLTKTSALVLVAVPIAFLVLSLLLKKFEVKPKIKPVLIMYILAAMVVLPWLLRNILIFGSIFGYNTISDLTAYSRHENYLLPLLNWSVLYVGYIILASGIIFGVLAIIGLIKNYRNEAKEGHFYLLLFVTVTIYIFIAANHASGGTIYKTPIPFFTERPIGRYIDCVLPLILIAGFINFYRYYEKINKYLIGAAFLLLFSAQLAIAPLLPVNNISLTYIGVYKYILENLLSNKNSFEVIFSWQILIIVGITLMLLCLSFILLKKVGLTKLTWILMLFFMVTNILAYGVTHYNAKTYWFEGDQMQMGYFFNKIDGGKYSTVLLDERDCIGKIGRIEQETLCENKISSIVGFFINDEIIVGDPEKEKKCDYVISKHKLNLDLVKEINGLYLYKKK